jgi:hypothetical protein
VTAGLTATALAAALLVAVSVALADAAFVDPAGDAGVAPDVQNVTITNVPETGQITITATFPANQTLTADQLVAFYVDSDNNTATGGTATGFDYFFATDASGAFDFLKLSGDTDDSNIPRTTLTARYAAGTLTLSINRSELGNTANFSVLIVGGAIDPKNKELAALDRAPDNGLYAYTVVLPPPPLLLNPGKPISVPGRPVVGGKFTVSLPVTRSDTNGPLTGGGIVSCTAQIGFKPIPASGRFAGGLARCTVKVPSKTSGKTLRGTVTVVFQGKTVKKNYTYRII